MQRTAEGSTKKIRLRPTSRARRICAGIPCHPLPASCALMQPHAPLIRHGRLIIHCKPRFSAGFPRACGGLRGVCCHLQGFRVRPRAGRCVAGGPGGGSREAVSSILTPQSFTPDIPGFPSRILCIASRYLIPNSAISWRVLAHPEQAWVSTSILQAPTHGDTGREVRSGMVGLPPWLPSSDFPSAPLRICVEGWGLPSAETGERLEPGLPSSLA